MQPQGGRTCWTPAHLSQARRDACARMGASAEADVERMAAERGYAVVRATPYQDRVEHWDLRLERPDLPAPLRVEVKATKVVNGTVDDRHTWLEIQGNSSTPRWVNHGWIFGGQATHVAFERADDFLFVERERLQPLAAAFDLTNVSVAPSPIAAGQVRRRPGRHDIIGLARTSDVEAVAAWTWPKRLPELPCDTPRLPPSPPKRPAPDHDGPTEEAKEDQASPTKKRAATDVL